MECFTQCLLHLGKKLEALLDSQAKGEKKNIRRGSSVVTNNHRNYCWALDNRKKVKILIYTER